jgi:thioredoxin 2
VFVKLNTEAHMSASAIFEIRGIPTLAIFNKGREFERLGGALPFEQFRLWFTQVLQKI